MKYDLIKNDKSTAKDEVFFSVITLIVLGAGLLLFIIRPALWIIDSSVTMSFGLILIILAIMYIPCIIYRFMTNDHKKG